MSRTLTLAFSALVISTPALAQTRVMTTHDQTASALKCLLGHNRKDCKFSFVAGANLPAQSWLWWNSNRDYAFGHLVSADYAGTEPQNAYTTRFLSGQLADVYDVRFAREEFTFYITPPGPDGKIRYLHIRNGTPNDERSRLFVAGPG